MNCTVDRLVVSLLAVMVRILGGSFVMGGGPEADEQPRRTVVVATFAIDADEVTRAEYAACVAAGACKAASSARADDATSKLPVTGVSWSDADTYAINLLHEHQHAVSTRFARSLAKKWEGVVPLVGQTVRRSFRVRLPHSNAKTTPAMTAGIT